MLARRVADALPLSYVGKMGINTYAIVTTLLTLLDLVGLLSLRFVGYYNQPSGGGQRRPTARRPVALVAMVDGRGPRTP